MDVRRVYERLRKILGARDWWKSDGSLEVVVGALLTQQTTWRSVDVALGRLKERGWLSLEGLAAAPVEKLEDCVKPTGFYRVKTARLQKLATRVLEDYGNVDALLHQEPRDLRQYLLGLDGIGPETADSILLYAAGLPFLVVDTYTRRIVERLGSPLPPGYEAARSCLEGGLPRTVETYREFHAMMVELGKRYCRRNPRCQLCPLLELCPHGQDMVSGR